MIFSESLVPVLLLLDSAITDFVHVELAHGP
jgi:hypothetical protein